MPFKTLPQARKCYALKKRNPGSSWDCKEWSEHTDYQKLVENFRKQAFSLGMGGMGMGGMGTPGAPGMPPWWLYRSRANPAVQFPSTGLHQVQGKAQKADLAGLQQVAQKMGEDQAFIEGFLRRCQELGLSDGQAKLAADTVSTWLEGGSQKSAGAGGALMGALSRGWKAIKQPISWTANKVKAPFNALATPKVTTMPGFSPGVKMRAAQNSSVGAAMGGLPGMVGGGIAGSQFDDGEGVPWGAITGALTGGTLGAAGGKRIGHSIQDWHQGRMLRDPGVQGSYAKYIKSFSPRSGVPDPTNSIQHARNIFASPMSLGNRASSMVGSALPGATQGALLSLGIPSAVRISRGDAENALDPFEPGMLPLALAGGSFGGAAGMANRSVKIPGLNQVTSWMGRHPRSTAAVIGAADIGIPAAEAGVNIARDVATVPHRESFERLLGGPEAYDAILDPYIQLTGNRNQALRVLQEPLQALQADPTANPRQIVTDWVQRTAPNLPPEMRQQHIEAATAVLENSRTQVFNRILEDVATNEGKAAELQQVYDYVAQNYNVDVRDPQQVSNLVNGLRQATEDKTMGPVVSKVLGDMAQGKQIDVASVVSSGASSFLGSLPDQLLGFVMSPEQLAGMETWQKWTLLAGVATALVGGIMSLAGGEGAGLPMLALGGLASVLGLLPMGGGRESSQETPTPESQPSGVVAGGAAPMRPVAPSAPDQASAALPAEVYPSMFDGAATV